MKKSIGEWTQENIAVVNKELKTEEDMKIKVLLPYLQYLGYETNEMKFEEKIQVNIGTKSTTIRSDIAIFVNGKAQMYIDAKTPIRALSEKDVLQVESYAKLSGTPHAIYGVVTNGLDAITSNTFLGNRTKGIPSKQQLLRDIDKAPKGILEEIEIHEVERVLFTLNNPKELYKTIKECKDIIEKRGLIRSDQSFKEMTKIILTKMNEERRVKGKEGVNRFSVQYLEKIAGAKKVSELVVFRELFQNAKDRYTQIYTKEDENLNITDNECIKAIVKNIQDFSFLGTGDDIKGTVYEIFLKASLRGEFDQYFTPREIVDFMVKFADPNMGDVILDPACGSGGFLIQAFNYVNKKINAAGLPQIENIKRYDALIEKCLWGHEADYDLHVLAKINLIMHGDGWNNIYQGDTLSSDKLKDDFFDLILANPPFTIPYKFKDVLNMYELGMGKNSVELDLLFVEKSIKVLKPGKDMYIVLPEGLLNIPFYQNFREWLLKKADVILSISLPEGAFIPFGGSVSKTCILGLRKKEINRTDQVSPKYVFIGRPLEIGYETGKKMYIPKEENDLLEFESKMQEVFCGVKTTSNGGECGWIDSSYIDSRRIDGNYLLNVLDRKLLLEQYPTFVTLGTLCEVENESIRINKDEYYNYLEVLDISENTGTITNIRKVLGQRIAKSLNKFYPNDILFSRINPRKRRVAIVPPINGYGVVSKEVYRLVYKENKYIDKENWYVLCALLQSDIVTKQLVRLATGSSSSRARVQVQDFLNDVYIPILPVEQQKQISDTTYKAVLKIWKQSQSYLRVFEKNQKSIGTDLNKNLLRGI